MIQLTEQQECSLRQDGWPPRLVNPRTGETFVLIHEEMFERVRAILEEQDDIAGVRDMYPLAQRAMDEGDQHASQESA